MKDNRAQRLSRHASVICCVFTLTLVSVAITYRTQQSDVPVVNAIRLALTTLGKLDGPECNAFSVDVLRRTDDTFLMFQFHPRTEHVHVRVRDNGTVDMFSVDANGNLFSEEDMRRRAIDENGTGKTGQGE